MEKLLTKKKVFWASLMGVAIVPVVGSIFSYDYCFVQGRCPHLWGAIESATPIFFLFLPLFLLSLITYWMREEVFRAWLRFAYWWIPLTILLVLMTEDGSGGFGVPSIITKESVSMIFSGLFLIISLLLIAQKSYQLRKENKS